MADYDPRWVELFAAEVEAAMNELSAELQALGLVKKPTKKKPHGSRDTKAAARLMIRVCNEKGLDIIATDTMEKKIRDGHVWTSAGITARVLHDMGVLGRKESRVILGAAVIDDILAMLLLGVVTALLGGPLFLALLYRSGRLTAG